MRNLKEVILSLTTRCNLRCLMCEIPLAPLQELTTAQWKKAIEDAAFIGAQTISLSGGEPLLRDDIFELISFGRSCGMETVLVSNGALICPETAKKLSQAGVNAVHISIEGGEETHDLLRGAGSFEKTVSGLRNLRESKIKTIIAATVSRYNYKDLPEVLKIASSCGCAMVKFQPFSDIFLRDKSKSKDFFIDKARAQELKNIIKKVLALSNEYGIITNPENYLNRIPAYLCGESSGSKNACSALWTSCPVNPRGDIYPCWVINEEDKKIGSLLEQGLCEIWLSPRHELLRQTLSKNGCGGCMMNCYDDIFGKNKTKGRLFNTARKLKNPYFYKKLARRSLDILGSETARIQAWQKTANWIKMKVRSNRLKNSEEIKTTLLEIERSKEKLRQEIDRCN